MEVPVWLRTCFHICRSSGLSLSRAEKEAEKERKKQEKLAKKRAEKEKERAEREQERLQRERERLQREQEREERLAREKQAARQRRGELAFFVIVHALTALPMDR